MLFQLHRMKAVAVVAVLTLLAAQFVAGSVLAQPGPVSSRALLSPAVPRTEYHEAPMLAAQSAAGLIPPLAQRLPPSPEVIQPHSSVGSYGGTWRTLDISWDPSIYTCHSPISKVVLENR